MRGNPPVMKLGSKVPSIDEQKTRMPCVWYSSVVGSLMFTIVSTKLDNAQVVGFISRFMVNPSKEHWRVLKCILKYLRGASDVVI